MWRRSKRRPLSQVQVRVAAASVNFPDVLLFANEYQVKVPTSFVPGSEFAGVVKELGDGADALVVGDRVTGTLLAGTFPEEAVVSARSVSRMPRASTDGRLPPSAWPTAPRATWCAWPPCRSECSSERP